MLELRIWVARLLHADIVEPGIIIIRGAWQLPTSQSIILAQISRFQQD